MKIKKGVLITHPVTDYREVCQFQNRQFSSSSPYVTPSPQKAILYHLEDGKFSFYFGKTSTGNSSSGIKDVEYHFRAKSNYDGSSLDFTLHGAKIYSRQTFEQERLLLAIKKELTSKKRKSLPESRAIEIGIELTSTGDNSQFYGNSDRRMVAKSLIHDLILGRVLKTKGLDKIVVS